MKTTLEYIVSHIEIWNKPDKSSEADYYARFSGLFEVVFQDVNIKLIRQALTFAVYNTVVAKRQAPPPRQSELTTKVYLAIHRKMAYLAERLMELFVIKIWNFASVNTNLSYLSSSIFYHKIKNLRSNSRVYHHLQALSPESDDLHIYGMDWRGKSE
ncbi:unnamed protein product [Absidia cylindrospora]